jgi:hypothetical protein
MKKIDSKQFFIASPGKFNSLESLNEAIDSLRLHYNVFIPIVAGGVFSKDGRDACRERRWARQGL